MQDNTAPEAVYDRIFEFLDKHRAEGLESMTDEAFEEIRNSLAAKKRQKEDNLSQVCFLVCWLVVNNKSDWLWLVPGEPKALE